MEKHPAQEQLSISAFFPAWNEEGSIAGLTAELLSTLEAIASRYEVIIVNDGSTDRTGEVADSLSRKYAQVRVIHHPRNLGYGMALRSGYQAARFEYVFYTDGDHQFDMRDIGKLLPLLPGADIVIGYRQQRQDARHRLFFSWAYNTLTRLIFGDTGTRDIDSSFKIVRKSVLNSISLNSEKFFIDTELIVKARRQGYRICETGVRHLPRKYGRSTIRPWHVLTTLIELQRLYRELRASPQERCTRGERKPGNLLS
jgi:glycosyltransferase involved in cell wall biosynthesis